MIGVHDAQFIVRDVLDGSVPSGTEHMGLAERIAAALDGAGAFDWPDLFASDDYCDELNPAAEAAIRPAAEVNADDGRAESTDSDPTPPFGIERIGGTV